MSPLTPAKSTTRPPSWPTPIWPKTTRDDPRPAGCLRGLERRLCRPIKARTPRTEKQTERGYDAASRATAFDLLRYLLPTATHTNIGLTLNARTLEHLITKLLSQPLEEGRELGARIKEEAQHIVPTLLKYADHNAYRAETGEAIAKLAGEVLGDGTPSLWR